MFFYDPSERFASDSMQIGSWSAPPSDAQVVKILFRSTADCETADRWQAELRAGRLPPPDDEP